MPSLCKRLLHVQSPYVTNAARTCGGNAWRRRALDSWIRSRAAKPARRCLLELIEECRAEGGITCSGTQVLRPAADPSVCVPDFENGGNHVALRGCNRWRAALSPLRR